MQYVYSDLEVSDLHKDALGYRPDASWWTWWNNSTPDEKQLEWDFLITRLQESNLNDDPGEYQEWRDYDPDC